MKFSKKRNQYEASNVTCNLETLEAYSYDWWKFLAVINGKVVFNEYNYSNTTRKHQSKVRKLLREHGINIDLEVSTSLGLNGDNGDSRYNNGKPEDALKDAIKNLKAEKEEIKAMLENNRRKKALDITRQNRIAQIESEIYEIELVMYGSKLGAVIA